MTPTNYKLAAAIIARFEGFEPVAKWDVNAWRLGYGSDTRTAAQIKVKRGDVETEADAFLNLQARIPQFESVIISQIGATAWNLLPQLARGALLSFAYNYGELTPTIEKIATLTNMTHGDLEGLAAAVYMRGEDNGGINRSRRTVEADLIGISDAL